MTFPSIDEIQKITLKKYNEDVEADFQKLVKTINLSIKAAANYGKFHITISALDIEPVARLKAKTMLKEQGYICSITGPDLYISWDKNEIYSN